MNVKDEGLQYLVTSDAHPGVEARVDKFLADLAEDRDAFLRDTFKRCTNGLEA